MSAFDSTAPVETIRQNIPKNLQSMAEAFAILAQASFRAQHQAGERKEKIETPPNNSRVAGEQSSPCKLRLQPA